MVQNKSHDELMSKDLEIGENIEDFKRPVPCSIKFEKEEKFTDLAGKHFPVTRETEEIDFQDLKEENRDGITYDEVKVSVKRGVSVMWTLVQEEDDLVITREIPWHRVIEIQYSHEEVEKE